MKHLADRTIAAATPAGKLAQGEAERCVFQDRREVISESLVVVGGAAVETERRVIRLEAYAAVGHAILPTEVRAVKDSSAASRQVIDGDQVPYARTSMHGDHHDGEPRSTRLAKPGHVPVCRGKGHARATRGLIAGPPT